MEHLWIIVDIICGCSFYYYIELENISGPEKDCGSIADKSIDDKRNVEVYPV